MRRPAPDRPAYFSERDAKRVARQTRERERQIRIPAFGDRPTAPRILGGMLGIYLIKTSSTLTARSGTTPGTGSGNIVTWNGTALGTGAAITLRNISAKAGGIATGKYGFALYLFGTYWVVSVEC